MRYIVYILLYTTTIVLGQQQVSGSYDRAPVQKVFSDFEAQSGYIFHYKTDWIDTLFYSGTIANKSISEALSEVFENTALTHIIYQDKIIITRKTPIITRPPIINSLTNGDTTIQRVEQGLLFEREYADDNANNEVFEIGNKQKMTVGGTSTIAGYIRSEENGDPLNSAAIYIQEPFIATSSDAEGFYSLKVPNGRHTLNYQFSGMRPTTRNVVVFSDGQLNVDMKTDVIALQEITVESRKTENVQNVQMGIERISMEASKSIPAVLGELDIVKIATTYAGVTQVGEGSAGFNVRGGKSDQNLILLDGAPIYNPAHFFGFFSVFNGDAIGDASIYKSSIPSKYGGRLSSVFDIQSKKAEREEVSAYGSISPVTAKLSAEVPLFDKKAGLFMSGRTTYSNWILSLVDDPDFRENNVNFYDMLVRYDHDLSENDVLRVSGYYSKDQFNLNSASVFASSDFSYSNQAYSMQYTRRFNKNLLGDFTGYYSSYGYDLIDDNSARNAFRQGFFLGETGLKANFNYYLNGNNGIDAGMELKRYQVNPGFKKPLGEESSIIPIDIENEQANQLDFYLSDEIIINPALTVSAGLRYALYTLTGPRTVYSYQENQPKNNLSLADSVSFAGGEVAKYYHGPEYRLSARYSINETTSFKASYNRTRQFIHTLTNTISLSPTDIWRLSSEHIRPQVADQFSAGFYKNFSNNTLEFSMEGYYKYIQNLLDFKVGANFLLNERVETAILQGPGRSYGFELSLKKSGRLNGYINYTFSRSFIQLAGDSPEETINEGEFYPTNYDIPHSVNLVSNFKFTERISFSYTLAYASGRPVTYPIGSYEINGVRAIHYQDRNTYRIPYYLRMDAGINILAGHRLDKLVHSELSFSVYNLLGRDNPFSVFFDVERGFVNASQLVIFAVPIPTITYTFIF